jgi:hypothetical protein
MKHYALRPGLTLVSAIVAGVVALSAPLAGAGRTDPPGARTAARTGTARPVMAGSRPAGTTFGSHTTAILGAAWNADNSPIKYAVLRLRNVDNGKVEALGKSNDVGPFAFTNVPGGSYVVELLSETGNIETIGHVFTIAPGETVATFVRLSAKVPWVASFFNNTLGAVASTAASEGLTAIAPMPLCSSPPCH